MTSEAAMELKTQEQREWVKSSLKTLCRKASLLHKILEHIESQFRASRGMVFEVYLASLRMHLPSEKIQASIAVWNLEPMTQNRT